VQDEPLPYTYRYGVQDTYSGANFNAAENADGTGNVEGSYSVLLPDGRTQHVTYRADDYHGFVADVTYEGHAAAYAAPPLKPYAPPPPPPTPSYRPAPLYTPAPYAPPPVYKRPSYHAPLGQVPHSRG
jgi:hypothetical protein